MTGTSQRSGTSSIRTGRASTIYFLGAYPPCVVIPAESVTMARLWWHRKQYSAFASPEASNPACLLLCIFFFACYYFLRKMELKCNCIIFTNSLFYLQPFPYTSTSSLKFLLLASFSLIVVSTPLFPLLSTYLHILYSMPASVLLLEIETLE